MTDLKFGTSGLRGRAEDLTDNICQIYMRAFLRHMAAHYGLAQGGIILVGRDLRASSPRIVAAICAAAAEQGYRVENCGLIPTPALAYAAVSRSLPAVMITGSHIPADRNGLKFYRPDGEIDKQDEAALSALAAAEQAEQGKACLPLSEAERGAALPAENKAAREAYLARALHFLPEGALRGLHIGIYQHSSVARDILAEIMQGLGAEITVLRRAEEFIPIDTEALSAADRAFAAAAVREHKLDALISTDGDGDRPLIADERGDFIHGDIIGILTALFLQADAVITPITSTTALEKAQPVSNKDRQKAQLISNKDMQKAKPISNTNMQKAQPVSCAGTAAALSAPIEKSALFPYICRTKVGSPYVLAAMAEAKAAGAKRIVGFEANGGVLLGSDMPLPQGGILKALPTRDAVLPILSLLALARQESVPLSGLRALLPPRFGKSGRLQNYPPERAQKFMAELADKAKQADIFAAFGAIQNCDRLDGLRFTFANGDIVHFRVSGNAPELRCYSEAAGEERAALLLQMGLDLAKRALPQRI